MSGTDWSVVAIALIAVVAVNWYFLAGKSAAPATPPNVRSGRDDHGDKR